MHLSDWTIKGHLFKLSTQLLFTKTFQLEIYFFFNNFVLFTDVVMMTYPEVTEIKIQEEMAKFLKYAPERAGGGGRQRRE